MDKILALADGKTTRSCGNTCRDTTVEPAGVELSMESVLRNLFARGAGSLILSLSGRGAAGC